MTAIPLGISAFHRSVAKTPNILLRNMVLEKDPSNLVDGMLRIQRAGLVAFAVAGSGPGRGIYQQDGTFGGDWLVVSGPTVYRVSAGGLVTGIGSVGGSDLCEIAASQTRAIIVSHGVAYSTDGTTLLAIAVPDIDGIKSRVSSVAYINGYFILCLRDSQRFFWIAPGETDPQPLNFASAENTPDDLVAVVHVYDELWFFGASSIEIWQTTGDNDLPFERINGRIYEKGCASRDTIREVDNTLFWVGADGIVYRGGDSSPVRISDTSIEEHVRLNTSGALRAWAYALDGHLFYVLTLGTIGTYAFDVSTGSWTQFSTYNRETWRAHLGRQSNAQTVLAMDDTTGDVWQLSTAVSNDNGAPMVRELAGGIAVAGNAQVCSNIEVFGAMGNAPITGTADDPKILLRWSDDFGRTWAAWRQMQIGKQGQYFKRAILRRLGSIRPPGRVFQFRFTDDTLFRVSYARMNEAVV